MIRVVVFTKKNTTENRLDFLVKLRLDFYGKTISILQRYLSIHKHNMKNKFFDTIVKKLSKYKNKSLEIKKIKQIAKNIMDTEYSDKKLYKILYYLKNRGYSESLKKDIFFIKHPEKKISKEELTDLYYRSMLKKHCNDFLPGKRYIGGTKALELHINSYDIPEEILVINEHKQATEKIIFEKQALFKIYEHNKKNLFPLFYKQTKKLYIQGQAYNVACLELAISESLYNQSIITKGYTEELIKKIIRKTAKHLNTKIREEHLKHGKHHSSINKLYKIAQTIDPTLAEKLKLIIKKYSYFL